MNKFKGEQRQRQTNEMIERGTERLRQDRENEMSMLMPVLPCVYR